MGFSLVLKVLLLRESRKQSFLMTCYFFASLQNHTRNNCIFSDEENCKQNFVDLFSGFYF